MLCIFAAVAQSKSGDVEGYVKNMQSQPVGSASVYLLRAADTGVVKFTTTDKAGKFSFANIKPNTYLIQVTGVGYRAQYSLPVVLKGNQIFDIGFIQLKAAGKNLGEVSISASKSFIETRPDRTILNIRNSNLAVGNNALEVLVKSPGVKVDNNNNISLFGKSDVLVMIDNKPTYLSGAALTDLLQGTQSSMIDKIELISTPNSSYDAGGTGGVINIRMIHDKNLGISAQVNADIGYAQFVGGSPTAFKNSSGINFNYRTKKLNIFGGYSYSDAPFYRSIVSNRIDSQNDMIGVNTFANQRKEANNFRIGADYSLTPKQTIGFLISDVITNQTGPRSITSVISNNGVTDSTIKTNALLNRKQTNAAYNINYRAALKNGGELTINGDFVRYNRDYNETFTSDYVNSLSRSAYRTITLKNTSPSDFNLYVLGADYHINVNTNNDFSTGFKSSYIKTNNTSSFGSVDGDIYIPNAAFTGRFTYTEKLNAGYIDYNHIFNKKMSVELGTRVEQNISDGITSNTGEDYKNNYFDFFPTVRFNDNVNTDNLLQLTYTRRVTRPRYEDLNPLVIYNDQYTYQIGNQYLKPFYSNLVELKHIYKSKITTMLSFEAISGFSQTIYMQSVTQPLVTFLKRVNLGNRYNYDLSVLAPVDIVKWYNVEFNLDFKYQQFTGTSPLGNLNSGSPDITFKVYQHFKLPLSIQADLNGSYETPTTYGVFRYKAQYYAWVSLSKSVLHKKGSIHFKVDGMFNSDKDVFTSNYHNLNLSSTQIINYRITSFGFIYSLGSSSIKAARKKQTGSEEEQNRM